jgi:hypothetical protein
MLAWVLLLEGVLAMGTAASLEPVPAATEVPVSSVCWLSMAAGRTAADAEVRPVAAAGAGGAAGAATLGAGAGARVAEGRC